MANLFEYILMQLYPGRMKSAPGRQSAGRRESLPKRPVRQERTGQKPEPVTKNTQTTQSDRTEDRTKDRAKDTTDMPTVSAGIVRRGERTENSVEKEDFLLSQIDEFREKAKQLQVLLASKESKVQELQSLVNEREDKAQELAQILTERQEEADKIVRVFSTKVDLLSMTVTSKMDEIGQALMGQVEQVKRTSEEQTEQNRKREEEQLAANRALNEEQIASLQKVSEEQLAMNKQFLEEQAIANKKLSEGQMAEVKALMENTTSQLESIKTDLSEKVHSENVKCYRNIQDLFNEFDSKIEKMDEMEKGVGLVKNYVKILTGFAGLNFIVLLGFILYSLGVFSF